ncbi:MAG TPA: glycosyltransferase [Pyrinomonadaceae bacterium]|jgi:glycosyltransferase involved in cell wall biosynthesis|nr:glycosyltransferase [Pyrinomonadaceae bacterium]
MRILLSSDHEYPASNGHGSGLHPKAFPSGSGYILQDLLAKGLAELGHEVFYLVRELRENSSARALPEGLKLIFEPMFEADVLHTISGRDAALIAEWEARGKPWVATCHMDERTRGRARALSTPNWVFVSQTLAQLHGHDRYVWNGIDPAEYIYSETKDDYFVFMSTMDWGTWKGLDTVISLTKRLGFKLVIAGTGESYERIAQVQEMCRTVDARYVGDVRGQEKAELLAGAKGFLFPTKLDEAFGLGMVEALMSGTPVICSDRGACPEIITPEVGFVCQTEDDYITAISKINELDPRACREKAMRDYHYHAMAQNYVREYEIERARIRRELSRPAAHHT